MIKICRPEICPLSLVRSIFLRVQTEKLPVSKHVVRIVPMQKVFFPNENELEENLQSLIQSHFGLLQPPAIIASDEALSLTHKRKLSETEIEATNPLKISCESESSQFQLDSSQAENEITEENSSVLLSSSEPKKDVSCIPYSETEKASDDNSLVLKISEQKSVDPPSSEALPAIKNGAQTEPVSTIRKKFPYCVQYKARNHNVLDKHTVYAIVNKLMPPFSRVDRKNYEVLMLLFSVF